MDISQWMEDLGGRLQLTTDLVDDLANSEGIRSEDLRERLFTVEAQLWRVSQKLAKRGACDGWACVIADLTAIRDALLECLRLGARPPLSLVCESEEAGDADLWLRADRPAAADEVLAELHCMASEMDGARAVLGVYEKGIGRRRAAGGRS